MEMDIEVGDERRNFRLLSFVVCCILQGFGACVLERVVCFVWSCGAGSLMRAIQDRSGSTDFIKESPPVHRNLLGLAQRWGIYKDS